MSAITLKSITGITSITTPAGVDNQLTLHTNNTTERLKINEVGNVRVANTFDCVGVSTFRNNLFAQADLQISGEIVHISDDNTRIQFPSNDNIAFKTAGTERFRITSSGEVKIMNTSGTVGLYFQSSSGAVSNFRAIGTNLQSLGYFFGNTERVRFASNGNVGISSTIPEQRLTVAGVTDITHYANTTINNNRLQLGFNAPEGYLKVKNTTASPAANLALYTTDTSGNTNKVIHCSYSGVIETGTAIGGSGYDSNMVFRIGRAGDCNLAIRNTANTTSHTGVDFGDSGDDRAGRIQYMHNGDYMSFHTNGAGSGASNERLRITSTGSINLTSENTTGWQLDAGDNSASYTAIDNHFPTTNRTLYINNETTHRSFVVWNKNGSDGYGFGLDNSGNFKIVYGTSERVRIDSTGRILLGDGAIATPKASVGGLDVSSGIYSIIMGGETNVGDGTGRRNSYQKESRLGMPHYTNAEEPFGLVYGVTISGENRLNLGGGSSIVNAATSIKLYTAANTTTTAGTERLSISSDGVVTISNSSPPATGAMTFITDDGSATTLGTAATFRVANNGSNGSYSVFEAESAQGCIKLSNDGRTLIGDHIGSPDATLHVIGKNNDGQHVIAQFGKTAEARYARFVAINNQQNFDHLLLRRYDNNTSDVLRLQNTYASGTGWGTGIGWYGHGGNITGRIKVVNATTNSSVARMHLEVNNQSIIHMDHAPNRVMVGQPSSAGGFEDQAPLQTRSSQSNTGCYSGTTTNYNTLFGLLPWASGGTYLSSGITYNNGSWIHKSDSNDNCLFYMKGGGWQWYSSNSGSGNWNVASSVNIMSSTGVWTGGTSSDRRLKDNITNMSSSDALTKVTQLQGVSYTWKNEVQKKFGEGPYPEGTHHGFIAQDVKTVWPDAHIITQTDNESDFDDDPTKDVKDDVYFGEIEGVKEEKMVPLLVEAIKELKKENDALKARVTTLEG